MGCLRQHGVGKVLHHEGHAVCLGPTGAQQGAGLGFAGFQSNSRPAQLATLSHVLPVMGAFIKEKGLAGAATVRVNTVTFQVVWKGLLHIKQHAVQAGMFVAQAIKNFIHVSRLGDGAVEVSCQPIHIVCNGDITDAHHARIIPLCVIAAQLDL